MFDADVIIIGAGLIGSMAAKLLRKNNYSVLIVDSEQQFAASKCAFGVWKKGWINKELKPLVDEGMDLLQEVCGPVQEIEFYNPVKQKTIKMNFVDPKKIIEKADMFVHVHRIINNEVHGSSSFYENYGDIKLKAKKAIFVAAGVYTSWLVNHPTDAYYGEVFRVEPYADGNLTYDWAPYKQAILLKTNDRYLFGDGSSVKNPDVRTFDFRKFSQRIQEHLENIAEYNSGIKPEQEKLAGYRPYLKERNHQYFKKHRDGLYSATGTAKNTTILCGHIAKQLLKSIQNDN